MSVRNWTSVGDICNSKVKAVVKQLLTEKLRTLLQDNVDEVMGAP